MCYSTTQNWTTNYRYDVLPETIRYPSDKVKDRSIFTGQKSSYYDILKDK